MKGYRTLIFNLIMAVSGLVGYHISPTVVAEYGDLFLVVVTVGNAVLRFVTDTPVGQRIARTPMTLGLTDIADAIAARLPKIDPAALAALIPAPGSPIPPPTFDFGALADSLGQAVESLQSVHATVRAAIPDADPEPQRPKADPAPAPAPAPQNTGGANA